ncbi:MAG: DUF3945 domain-containing protein [Mangrovibacterium sp.]
MSDETELNPTERVLVAIDEGEGNRAKVVRGIKRGKLDLLDPLKAKQNDFLRVDRHADVLENFFKNFANQAKNPSHTGFFLVAVNVLDKLVQMDMSELEKYRVNPRDFLQEEQVQQTNSAINDSTVQQKTEDMEQKNERQKTEFTQLDVTKIADSEFQKLGINPQAVEGELKAMSYGFKSPHLVDINPTIDEVQYPSKARISLEAQEDGSLKIIPHPYQQQADLERPFHGVMLSDEVKESLLQTGNGGKVVELDPQGDGKLVPSLVSIDKLTNRLEAVPVDSLRVNHSMKGAELSDEQVQALKEGKKVLVEQMTTKKSIGTDEPVKFDAYVQFNAARGSYDFSYEGIQNAHLRAQKTDNPSEGVRIPTKLLGAELSEKQQDSLRMGNATYVQQMTDKKGEPFNAYVRVNAEKNKLDFFRWNPDRAKKQGAEVKPAEESKTQVAVNSQGKTNEATKQQKEPLKQGQTQAAEKPKRAVSKKKTSPKL